MENKVTREDLLEAKLSRCKNEYTSLFRTTLLYFIITLITIIYWYVKYDNIYHKSEVEKRIYINKIMIYKIDSVRTSYSIKMLRTWNYIKENKSEKEISAYIRNHKIDRRNATKL